MHLANVMIILNKEYVILIVHIYKNIIQIFLNSFALWMPQVYIFKIKTNVTILDADFNYCF